MRAYVILFVYACTMSAVGLIRAATSPRTYAKHAMQLNISSIIFGLFSLLTDSSSPTGARTHTHTHTRRHLTGKLRLLNKSGCNGLRGFLSCLWQRHWEVMRWRRQRADQRGRGSNRKRLPCMASNHSYMYNMITCVKSLNELSLRNTESPLCSDHWGDVPFYSLRTHLSWSGGGPKRAQGILHGHRNQSLHYC